MWMFETLEVLTSFVYYSCDALESVLVGLDT